MITVERMREALKDVRGINTIHFITPDGKAYPIDYVHLDLLSNRVDLSTSERD